MGDKKNVNLTIDSRIISHLGEALIDNEKVALLELIKNSSDADALNCLITIDTTFDSKFGKGRIVIEDNGNGMNPYIIENAFLKVATSFKKNNQKFSPRFKRLAQGNKGIGRLALNQLGNYLTVKTKLNTEVIQDFVNTEDLLSMYGNSNLEQLISDNNDLYYSFEIDWNKYENFEGKVEDVPIELENNKFSTEIFEHKNSYGTKIEVLGLKGLEFWKNSNTVNELETDVLAFLNPYIDEKSNFKVKIILDNQVFRNDIYDKEYISASCDSMFSFYFEESSNNLSYKIHRSKDYIKRQITKLENSMDKYDCDLIEKNIPYEDYYKKFSLVSNIINLEKMSSINKTSPKSKMDDVFSFVIDNEDTLYLPGSFSGTLYGYDFSATAIDTDTKKMLKNITGVKLYRNNFRIFPYGNIDNDWLGMSNFNQRIKSVVYKTHTTTGFININGEKNLEVLREITNRQGLVLDKYGKNFLLIMKELVFKNAAYEDIKMSEYFSFIRRDIAKLKSGESITVAGLVFKKRPNYRESALTNVTSIDEQIHKIGIDNNPQSLFFSEEISTATKDLKKEVNALKKDIINIEKEYENKDKQISDEQKYFNELLPIIGATIISETLAHEIIRLSQNVKSYSSKLREAIPKNDDKAINRNLNNIDSDIKFLSRYASLLDVNSYSKKRKFEILNLKTTIHSILNDSPLLSYKNIKIDYEISGNDFDTKVVNDSLKIIIENFVINSTYWLEKMRISKPKLTFKLNSDKHQLIVYDNGIGIHKDVEKRIFEPFISNKPNSDGRGMGLNIIESLLKEIGATIYLSSDENQDGNKYKFIINFSEDLR